MNELHIVIAVAAIAVLLMIILIYLIVREIILTKTKITDGPAPLEPAKQPTTNILSNESISEAETRKESERELQTVEPTWSAESDSKLDEK